MARLMWRLSDISYRLAVMSTKANLAGFTTLHQASRLGSHELLRLLLDWGADPHSSCWGCGHVSGDKQCDQVHDQQGGKGEGGGVQPVPHVEGDE